MSTTDRAEQDLCRRVARQERDPLGVADREVSASLIAAAPDLLAALKAASPMISDHAAGGRRLTRPEDASKVWDQIRAAIAKAEGR